VCKAFVLVFVAEERERTREVLGGGKNDKKKGGDEWRKRKGGREGER